MNDQPAICLPTPAAAVEVSGLPSAARGEASTATVQRLQLLRFPLAISVLFFHSARPVQALDHATAAPALQLDLWAAWLQGLFSHGLGGIRMPAFFAISGFLFFANCAGTRDWIERKLASRVRSVLVPLLAWNALLLPVLLLLQAWSASNAWFSGVGAWSRPVADYGVWQVFDALLGLSGHPIVYPLWFLRDLFLMCLLAPLYLIVPRSAQVAVVVVLGLLWFGGAWPYQVPTIEALFFFFAGALAALRQLEPAPLDRRAGVVFAVFAVLAAAQSILPNEMTSSMPALLHLTQLAALAALLVTTLLVERLPMLSRTLHRLAAPSFLIFVAHEPLLTAVRRLLQSLWPPQSSGGALIHYFAGVSITTVLLIALFHAARRWAPRALTVLTGSRFRAARTARTARA